MGLVWMEMWFINRVNDQPASVWGCEMLKNPLILHKWAVRNLHTQFKAPGRDVRNRICGALGWWPKPGSNSPTSVPQRTGNYLVLTPEVAPWCHVPDPSCSGWFELAEYSLSSLSVHKFSVLFLVLLWCLGQVSEQLPQELSEPACSPDFCVTRAEDKEL